jgi:hypothetical protein
MRWIYSTITEPQSTSFYNILVMTPQEIHRHVLRQPCGVRIVSLWRKFSLATSHDQLSLCKSRSAVSAAENTASEVWNANICDVGPLLAGFRGCASCQSCGSSQCKVVEVAIPTRERCAIVFVDVDEVAGTRRRHEPGPILSPVA